MAVTSRTQSCYVNTSLLPSITILSMTLPTIPTEAGFKHPPICQLILLLGHMGQTYASIVEQKWIAFHCTSRASIKTCDISSCCCLVYNNIGVKCSFRKSSFGAESTVAETRVAQRRVRTISRDGSCSEESSHHPQRRELLREEFASHTKPSLAPVGCVGYEVYPSTTAVHWGCCPTKHEHFLLGRGVVTIPPSRQMQCHQICM